ncbi:MAG: ABC transporter permease subunit [Monoglobales bacterium]
MKFLKTVKKNGPLLAMVFPGVAFFILFNYIPMFGLLIAFKNFNFARGIIGSKWAGLNNFKFLVMSGDAFLILRNTILYALFSLIVVKIIEIFLAIMYDSLSGSKLNRFNQTVSILPHFLSWVVVAYFGQALLDSERGLFNQILGTNIQWYSEPKYWPFILTSFQVWKVIGYGSIIYYSNIRGIDSELYEAARIDGATWWQQVKYITIPLLQSIIIIMVIMGIGGILYSDFGLFYNVPRNSGALYSTTQTLDTYIYNGITLAGGSLGMSSAAGFFQSTVGFLLVIISNAIIKKVSPENAMF